MGPKWPPLVQKNITLRTQPQMTSFGAKNVTLQTRGPKWPPLVQKTLHYEHRAPNDLLWCQKRYVTNKGPQLTSFGARTVHYEHRAPKWPPLVQKSVTLWTLGPKWPPLMQKRFVTNRGTQLTFKTFRFQRQIFAEIATRSSGSFGANKCQRCNFNVVYTDLKFFCVVSTIWESCF